MKKLLLAGICCAGLAAPALAQAHLHTASCNHQWSDNQGTVTAESLALPIQSFTTGGLTFVLNDLGGVGPGTQALAGFQAAAAMFSHLFVDPITIRLDVRFATLEAGILGSTGSTTNTIGYNLLRSSLQADISSGTDIAAVGSLGAGPISFVTNEPPISGPIDTRTRFLDNNNSVDNNNIQINTAQVKALGRTPTYNPSTNPDGRDGSVTFSNAFTWDFDPTDGITAGSFDFVGVAAHEIGHALGFRSGVDLADVNGLPAAGPARGLGAIAWGTVHDLWRYGTFDKQFVRDWGVNTPSCYSLDSANCLYLMSTGRLNGDRRQASHWKDNLPGETPIGLMDPSVAPSLQLFFTQADIRAFDAMGYDLRDTSGAIPEPATWAMLIIGFGFVGGTLRRHTAANA